MHKDVIDRSTGFFVQIEHDLILNIKDARAFLVYSILKTYSNRNSVVFPSRETIAEQMGAKTTKPVDEALSDLHEMGLVATFPRWKDGKGNTSRAPSETFKSQTSNGYILYGKINMNPQPGWDDPEGGLPKGNPGGFQKGTRGASKRGHEQEPSKQQPGEQYPPNPQGDDGLDRFDEFWETYGHKKNRGGAERAWRKAIKHTDPQEIINAAKLFIASQKSLGKHPQYTPYPSTWLNGKRWLDDVEPPEELGGFGYDISFDD